MLKFIIGILFLLINFVNGGGPHQYVKYYEHLTYDRFHIKEQHERVKRSVQNGDGGPSHVSLKFQSHGGHFNIRLVQDNSIFHTDLELVDSQGNPLDADVSHVYHGTVYGKKNSLVHGSIVDGVFTGVIRDPDRGTYYVEHADAFLKGKPFLARKDGHSIIYHEKDIDYPHKYGPHKTCGSSFSDIEKRMKEIQKTVAAEDREHDHLRKKRSVTPEKNTCLLFIRTDIMLWEEMQSRKKIVAKISEHVKALNDMYQATHFDTPDGVRIRNIGFMVKRMLIKEPTTPPDQFSSRNIGVEKFLELASNENHNEFCLAYVFTQRDFDNGVLGLAWVGGASSSGGICDEYRQYDGKAGKSLNTGIVTFENYGSTVPSRVSHITFAHEVGHNFGSPHDSGIHCTPGESGFNSDGNFIMFASATSGQKKNNRFFSDCSIGNMSKVLEAKKDKCFVESDQPICGNSIVDEGEECDCGYEDTCTEVGDINCCHPADDKDKGCKLKENAQCSITQGPCCDANTCVFKPATAQCSPDAECQEAQNCDAKSAPCPPATPKGNGSVECNFGTQVCWSGECSGSICQKYEMEECSCPIPDNGDTSIACQACCKQGQSGECKSTSHPDYAAFFEEKTINLQPGSPCDDFKGYCDMFSKCRKVDADGPLSRLKKAILNPELYKTIKEWIVQYWWAVALMCLALIMLMAGFIKLCSVHTPSNNPRLPKHRQLPGAETLRRRRQAYQRRQQPPPYQQQMRNMRRH